MPKRGYVFQKTGSLHPGKNYFDLSHEIKLTCDFGQLIPICFQELSPGDVFKISNSIVLRMAPLVHPIMHEISIFTHYFFVPTRLIWEPWETFITGGEDGNDDTPLPIWEGTESTKYSLWDYFSAGPLGLRDTGFGPIDFPKRCYNLIYNEYYRDENLIEEVDILQPNVLNRAWTKDYFTSALPFQQRGTSPSFPITGDFKLGYYSPGTSQVQATNVVQGPVPTTGGYNDLVFSGTLPPTTGGSNILSDSGAGRYQLGFFNDTNITNIANRDRLIVPITGYNVDNMMGWAVPHITVDDSDITLLADINDIRQAFQLQKWMERNARAGVRYTEFLQAHFSVHPKDERLQRPEYIGGSKSPIIISEVLQTSSSDSVSAQGNLAGHGITADNTRIGSYHAVEFGYIVGILSVMPRPAYQQGIPRELLRRTRYDFYFREFANLSERGIYNAEILAINGNDDYNTGTFGFTGIYDELRISQDRVCADMRDDFDKWHLGRIFDESQPPNLNQSFIECDSQTGGAENPLKRIFAVPSERGLIINFANHITAIRPMPVIPEPGLVDHY